MPSLPPTFLRVSSKLVKSIPVSLRSETPNSSKFLERSSIIERLGSNSKLYPKSIEVLVEGIRLFICVSKDVLLPSSPVSLPWSPWETKVEVVVPPATRGVVALKL